MNSNEFDGTTGVIEIGKLKIQRNSMEFHATLSFPILMSQAVPRNSMVLC